MKLNDFDYDLPEELIAQYPHQQRDQARLLIIDRKTKTLTHDIFANLGKYIPKQSTFVINNSKVIPARLLGNKQTGAQIEVFVLKRIKGRVYETMLRPLKRLKEGDEIVFEKGLKAKVIDRDQRWVEFNCDDLLSKLVQVGHIPLPPYIKRKDEALDHQEYQTVYAHHAGSVAAPTAGLHFTKPLMQNLKEQGHIFKKVMLHVGYGTFKPVEEENIQDHPMHEEEYSISEKTWTSLKKAKNIISVGTTSTRVLESVASTRKLKGKTNLFLYPGKEFKMVDALITNFHLPRSTLLMLVSAFATTKLMQKAYKEAIKQKYRFYSYGDAMLIK